MGWASGSYLADALYNVLIEYIPEQKRIEVAEKIIKAFEQMDCDVMEETQWYGEVWEWSDEKDDYVHKVTGKYRYA